MGKVKKQHYEHARLLLPWYITNKLTPAEVEKVEVVLKISPKLQLELKEQQQLATMVQEDPDVLNLVTISSQEKRLDNLMERIEQSSPRLKVSFWKQLSQSLSERFDAFRSSIANHQLQAAFSLFIVAQVAIIAVVINKPVVYQLAGDTSNQVNIPDGKKVLIFQFTSQAKELDINKLFGEIGAQVVEHSEGSANYKVFLLDSQDDQEVDDLISDLQKKKGLILLIGRGSN